MHISQRNFTIEFTGARWGSINNEGFTHTHTSVGTDDACGRNKNEIFLTPQKSPLKQQGSYIDLNNTIRFIIKSKIYTILKHNTDFHTL